MGVNSDGQTHPLSRSLPPTPKSVLSQSHPAQAPFLFSKEERWRLEPRSSAAGRRGLMEGGMRWNGSSALTKGKGVASFRFLVVLDHAAAATNQGFYSKPKGNTVLEYGLFKVTKL